MGFEDPTKNLTKAAAETEQIDAVALNNKIVNIEGEKARAEAIANLSQEEISAVAENIAKSKDTNNMLRYLDNFGNKPEIVSSPQIIDAFKKRITEGNTNLFDLDRIADLPASGEIFSDPTVQKGIQDSIKRFVSYQKSGDWEHVGDNVDRVVEKANISDQGLRDIADSLGVYTEARDAFVKHFGVRRLYPELK